MRDGDQIGLVLHGADGVGTEFEQQLFSRKALAGGHGHFVTTVSPYLHAVGILSRPALRYLKPGRPFQGGHVSHQQAVACVYVLDYLVDLIRCGCD